jgi:hypothetical protein
MKTNAYKPNIIKQYKHAARFYLLATIIPWALWYTAGYFSHSEPHTQTNELLTGLFSFTGLLAPVALAMFYIIPNVSLRKDILGRIFNFSSIKKQYILLAFFLMPVSILCAQAISILAGYSIDQFALRGTFTFTSSVFPV